MLLLSSGVSCWSQTSKSSFSAEESSQIFDFFLKHLRIFLLKFETTCLRMSAQALKFESFILTNLRALFLNMRLSLENVFIFLGHLYDINMLS